MDVIHNEEEQKFQIFSEGVEAFLGYEMDGNEILMYTTQVPKELGGKGVGSLLAKTALDFAVEHHYKIVSSCSFISTYIERHKEYKDYL